MGQQPDAAGAAAVQPAEDQHLDRFYELRDAKEQLLLWTTADVTCTESLLVQGEPGSQGTVLGYSRVAATRSQPGSKNGEGS